MPEELCFPFPLYHVQRSSGDYPDTYPMVEPPSREGTIPVPYLGFP